ncbi:GGDEF domain-containing protein [Sphingomonas sp.]|uniref:GGDEF domain-containing protein n=1 Tax=Sphingomonas sp. TaxID=28214 RepID=UPI00258A2BEC|nr:GGDEF domain-containing protein [Sphingomonas sp.]
MIWIIIAVMMLPIDNFTICFAAALIAFTFGAAFLVLWTRYLYAGYLLEWSAAGLAYGAGILAQLMPPAPVSRPLGVLSYLLLAGSTALIVSGIRRFERTPLSVAMTAVIALPPPAAFALGSLYLPAGSITIPAAIALTLSLTMGGVSLARALPVPHTGWRRIVGWTMLGFVPSYLISLASHFHQDAALDAAARVAYLSHIPLLLIVYVGLLAMPGARAIGRLRASGYRDALTGLRNRAWLTDHGPAWARNGTAIVIIDVDHFKQINDTHGHEAGDIVLARIAKVLKTEADGFGGEAIRLGGDEFLVLLPAQPTGMTGLAGRFAAMSKSHDEVPAWRFSFGIARWSDDDHALQATIGRADRELYAAKRARVIARAA